MIFKAIVLTCGLLLTVYCEPIVQTHCGPVLGHIATDPSIVEYLGIPYAKAATKAWRWRKPEFLEREDKSCWQGTFKADNFGPLCPQRGDYNEDCLSINVWTPLDASPQKLKPVMVFIPGGGLVEEGSSTFGYQAKHIATSGQISVSFNYRIGAFGFFALKSLSERDGGDEYSPSGNWGIMDQILALHWVRRNIKNFGGDPDQVTIFGHSSGGTSVYMLLASPLATYRDSTGVEKMLFHRLISMSGSIVINTPLHVSHKENQAIVERTKCKGLIGLHQLECLENVPVEDIINVTLRQSELYPYYNNFTYSQGLPLPGEHQPGIGIVDGHVLREPMFNALERGDTLASQIPVVIGTMRQEVEDLTQMSLPLLANLTCDDYVSFLHSWPGVVGKVADNLANLYPCSELGAYRAIITMASDIRAVCGNIHMAHILRKSNPNRKIYFYNSPHHLNNYVMKLAFHGLDIKMLLHNFSSNMRAIMKPRDYQFAELLFDSLTHFAKEGTMPKGSLWKEFGTSEKYFTNVLTIPPSVIENFNLEECKYISSLGFDKSWWTGE